MGKQINGWTNGHRYNADFIKLTLQVVRLAVVVLIMFRADSCVRSRCNPATLCCQVYRRSGLSHPYHTGECENHWKCITDITTTTTTTLTKQSELYVNNTLSSMQFKYIPFHWTWVARYNTSLNYLKNMFLKFYSILLF